MERKTGVNMSILAMKDIGLVTKIKAIYGKRLRFEDYMHLKQMHSVSEVAAYLKKHPGYIDVLKDVEESSMHRELLEVLLKEEMTKEYSRIINFVKGEEKKLLYCMIIHLEIEEIMYFLRTLISENREEYVPRISPKIIKHSEIDFEQLKSAKSFSALIEQLEQTRYYIVLKQFMKDEFIDYTKIEIALRSLYFKYILNAIEKYVLKEDKKILLDYVGGQIDITNFSRIIRCKKYFSSDDIYIYSELLPLTYKLDRKKINAMTDASVWEESYEMIHFTAYKKLFSNFHYDLVEQYYYEFIWEMARKIMHSNRVSVSVGYAYLNIKQIEISNLINIIECIRYQVDIETIDRHLIGVDA